MRVCVAVFVLVVLVYCSEGFPKKCLKKVSLAKPGDDKKITSRKYPKSKKPIYKNCDQYRFTIKSPEKTYIYISCKNMQVDCEAAISIPQLNVKKLCKRKSFNGETRDNSMTFTIQTKKNKNKNRKNKNIRFQCTLKALRFPTCKCGKQLVSPKIINGEDVTYGEIPYQVAMVYEQFNFVYCGGSLISDKFVITAAHCQVIPPVDVVRVGEHQISANDSHQQDYHIKRVITHPLYDNETLRYDITLVELVETVVMNIYVQPICLPDPLLSKDFDGADLQISGWGVINGSDPRVGADILQKALEVGMNNTECSKTWIIFPQTICTITNDTSACYGDSGGPLAHKAGRWYLIGLVSFGRQYCPPDNSPIAYTRVSHMGILKWIKLKTGMKCVAPEPTN